MMVRSRSRGASSGQIVSAKRLRMARSHAFSGELSTRVLQIAEIEKRGDSIGTELVARPVAAEIARAACSGIVATAGTPCSSEPSPAK